MARKNCLMFLALLSIAMLSAQSVGQDSVNQAAISAFKNKVQADAKQKTADSIARLQLEAQISQLRSSDEKKKQELERALQRLSARDSVRRVEKKQRIDSLRASTKGAPVIGFFKDTLFTIYSKLGSFSQKDRAEAISRKIQALGGQFTFDADSLRISQFEDSFELDYRGQTIMSISENDAIWNNDTKAGLAKTYRGIVLESIRNYKAETGITTLLKEIGLAAALLLVVVLIIVYIGKFFRWLALKITAQKDKLFKGIKIRDYTLFDSSREIRLLLSANTVVKWIVVLLLIYIALPILLGIFPWTQGLADQLFGYVLNPIKKMAFGFWNYLPNLFTILVIFIVFRYLIKAMRFLKNEIANGNLQLPGFYPDWANPTYQILRILVYAFMIVVIFPYLPGSDSPIFKGVSVFLGFLFTFGSAGSLSNVIAGLVLTYMRLFRLGDRVKIGDITGDIIEKSLLVTRIRTIKNEIISIPNATVMNSHTINYSSDAVDRGLILHTTITIGYDVPWKDIQQAMLEAADRTTHLLKDPPPFVLQTSLEDFYVAYQINAYTREAGKQAMIYSELHAHIQDCCNEAGIEILSPHYRAARDGNASTIPTDYLPRDYKAPSFQVKNLKQDD